MATISGCQIDLPEGRHVFHAEHEGKHFFRFRNSEGEETKFSLSGDATQALILLLTQSLGGGRWVLADTVPDLTVPGAADE